MKRSLCAVILLVFSVAFMRSAMAREAPVMLHLSGKNQPDTLGTNLVEYLPQLLYKEVIEGRVKLWEGPSKEKQVSVERLNEIEQSTATLFTKCNDLFLFEVWVIKKKHITPFTFGIGFVTQNTRGEEVSFGYVDYNDIRTLLRTNRIPCNANANFGTTYEDAIMQRIFVFTLMQYNKKTFKTVIEAKQAQDELLHTRKYKYTAANVSQREITYSISFANASNEQSSINAINILQAFENYFSRNIQDFLNIGGDKLHESTTKAGVSLLAIEITELWSRHGIAGNTTTNVERLKFYFKSGELSSVSYNDVATFNVTVGTRAVWDVIGDKKFDYRLVKINDQLVSPTESIVYVSGLKVSPWNKLLQYQRSIKQ